MAEHRFYGELARWWPLVSPVEDYADEAAEIGAVLGSALATALGPGLPVVPEVLELGSGGGHNAAHLADRFAVTLVDLSPDMLAVSRRLNPDRPHHEGDMRTVRLGREFDAVLVHDAIDYMTTEHDLRLALETAYAHCRPGGVLLLVPDHTAETFEPGSDHGGTDEPDGAAAVRYLEWTWDPDPGDTTVLTEYSFLLREADGTVRAVHETHRTGLFGRAVWLRLLADVGFDARLVHERAAQDRAPREFFLGHRVG